MTHMLLFPLIILLLPFMFLQQEIRHTKDTPELWKSKGGLVADWPTKQLDPYKQSYKGEELKDWFCIQDTNDLTSNDTGLFFDNDEITMEAEAWTRDDKPRLVMLHFLVKLAVPIVERRSMVTYKMEAFTSHFNAFPDANAECAPDDVIEKDTFRDSNGTNKVTPVCRQQSGKGKPTTRKFGNQMQVYFTFTCSAPDGQQEFWQPKLLPSTFPASGTHGILSIGYVMPFPYKCKANGPQYRYHWKRDDYKLMVHKDDMTEKAKENAISCLDHNDRDDPTLPPPTTITPTTSKTPINTTAAPITATTTMGIKKTKIPGRRTQWRFGTRPGMKMMAFMDKITPFPPGARAVILGDK